VGHDNDELATVSDRLGVGLKSPDTDPIVADGDADAETVLSEDIVGVLARVDVIVTSTDDERVMDSVSVALRFPPLLLMDHVTDEDGVFVFVCVVATPLTSLQIVATITIASNIIRSIMFVGFRFFRSSLVVK
jgi:hypothetical protein